MKVPAVLAGAAVFACGFIASPARADVWTKSWSVSASPQIRVHVDHGNIRVETSDVPQAKALVRTVGWRIAEDEVRVHEQQAGDRLEVEVKVPPRHLDFHVRLEITVELTVPRNAGLDLHTDDGNITTRGLEGALRADTGDGNITATGGKGTIRLHTGDGNITGDELDGSLTAETGDGNVSVMGRFDIVDMQTGDGNMEVTASVGSRLSSPWKIRTSDGNIVVRLPEGVGADLDATTGGGKVTVDFPVKISGKVDRNVVRGPMNGGGPEFRIYTGDGDIKVERR